jgi:ABC-type multidrug transport system ATPase subunit
MLVGPAKALFMDEISTGLDSSTTYQIVNSLRQSVHILGGTALIALLQPAPETYDLFDDIMLLSEGKIVYQGPRENVLEFFESMGFKCPERKGVADFLQEVSSFLFMFLTFDHKITLSSLLFHTDNKLCALTGYIKKRPTSILGPQECTIPVCFC